MSELAEMVTVRSLILHIIGGAWGKEPGKHDVDVISFGTKAFVNDASILDPKTGASRSVSTKQYEQRQLLAGDIILEVSGGSENQAVGRVLIVPEDMPFVIPSSFMRLVRFDPTRIVPQYGLS